MRAARLDSRIAPLRIPFVLYFFVSVASLILRISVPANPLFNAMHDDALMIRLAGNILTTGWVSGDWSFLSHLTMLKGPGFPLFLVINHFLPWSPVVSVHLLLLSGFYLLTKEFGFYGMSSRFQVLFFLFLSFFPAWFDSNFSRIYREGLLTALTFFVIAISLQLRRKRYSSNFGTFYRGNWHLLILLGALIGLFAITKISWHGLVLFAVLVVVIASDSNGFSKGKFLSSMRNWLVITLTIFVPAFFPPSLVMGFNQARTGVPIIEEFSQGEFPALLNSLAAVKSDDFPKTSLIDSSMREKIYQISPEFQELRPYLESEINLGWKRFNCELTNVCDESGLWFPFELRDAIAATGKVHSDLEMQVYMASISERVDAACFSGDLACGGKGFVPMVGNLSEINYSAALSAASTGIAKVLFLQAINFDRSNPSELAPEIKEEWFGLLPSLESTNGTESDVVSMSQLTAVGKTWIMFYAVIWVPVLLIGLVGVLFIKPIRNRHFNLSLASLAGIGALILPISLVEASSGLLMSVFGNPYLLATFPYAAVIWGLGLLVISKYSSKLK